MKNWAGEGFATPTDQPSFCKGKSEQIKETCLSSIVL